MPISEIVQRVGYPQWYEERQKQLADALYGTDAAKGLIQQPLTVPGQQVAGFTYPQQAGMELAQRGIGAYQPYLDAATAAQTAALGTAGAGAATVAGAQFEPTAARMAQFMDPYQQNVTQEALAEIERQGQLAQQGVAGQAVKAGAFGGSRYGIQQAELGRSIQDLKSRRIFEDLSRNYQQAMGASQAANQQRIQAGQAFGQLGSVTSGIGQRTGQLGQAAQAAGQADVQQLMGIGGLQQQLAQTGFDVGRQNELTAMMEPYRRLGFAGQSLQQLGPGTTQQTLQPMPVTNPYTQAAGLATGFMGGLGSLIG